MERRDFLLATGGLLLTGAASAYGCRLLGLSSARAARPEGTSTGKRFGMVIDLTKCRKGCTACLTACREENNVGHHDDPRWDIHWIRKVQLRSIADPDAPEKSVVLLCNHCDNPPCAQVCPVRATYKRDDGIVIVDHHRCIGCRYCMIACPYNARYFNFKGQEEWNRKGYPKRSHGVAEGCTLCAHRLDRGEQPACVEACAESGGKAITVGDMNDPESEISRKLAATSTRRLKQDLGTEPKVHYIGL